MNRITGKPAAPLPVQASRTAMAVVFPSPTGLKVKKYNSGIFRQLILPEILITHIFQAIGCRV